jgi:hypothetical protein
MHCWSAAASLLPLSVLYKPKRPIQFACVLFSDPGNCLRKEMKVMVPKRKQGMVVWLMKLRDQPIIKLGREASPQGDKGCLVVRVRSYTSQKLIYF